MTVYSYCLPHFPSNLSQSTERRWPKRLQQKQAKPQKQPLLNALDVATLMRVMV